MPWRHILGAALYGSLVVVVVSPVLAMCWLVAKLGRAPLRSGPGGDSDAAAAALVHALEREEHPSRGDAP